MTIKEFVKTITFPVLFASLCCLSPLVLFGLGLATASVAASWSDRLYYGYAWAFRLIGILILVWTLLRYFKARNICTLDQARRRKNEIMNTVFIVFFGAVLAYIFWLYVVVHYVGVYAHVWK